MPLPVSRQTANIKRTITRKIGNSIAVGALVVKVYPDWRWSDPDAIRGAGGIPDDQWIALSWLLGGAGRFGSSTLQVDVFSRILGENNAGGDPFGITADDIADEVEGIFAGVDGTGLLRAWFYVYDFTVNPAAPTKTDGAIVCQTSAGRLGQSEDRRRIGWEKGFQRVAMTLRFRLVEDMPNDSFYTA